MVNVLTNVLTQKERKIMPSLWKRKKSPFWVCCYVASDGRRLKKSTKQTDRKEKALEVCLALERAESMARQGTFTEARARELVGKCCNERPANRCRILPLKSGSGIGLRQRKNRRRDARTSVTGKLQMSLSIFSPDARS